MSASHVCGQNVLHLEWCPKYRYAMLKQERFINACDGAVRNAAQRHGIAVLELSVMPDHVHAVVEVPFAMSASEALRLLKGCSSRALFQLEPKFRLRYPKGCFWSRGSFVRAVGDANLETVRRYVRFNNDPFQQKLAA